MRGIYCQCADLTYEIPVFYHLHQWMLGTRLFAAPERAAWAKMACLPFSQSQLPFGVQVTSRGQVQYWNSQNVSFTSGPLTVDDALLVAPLKRPFSPLTARGTIQLAVSLPPATTHTAKVGTIDNT